MSLGNSCYNDSGIGPFTDNSDANFDQSLKSPASNTTINHLLPSPFVAEAQSDKIDAFSQLGACNHDSGIGSFYDDAAAYFDKSTESPEAVAQGKKINAFLQKIII